MKTFLNKFTAAVFMAGLLFSSVAYAQTNPVTELNSIADQLINKLKENKTTLKDNPAQVYSIANDILVPYADINEMAKRVLPPKIWNSASSSQRSEFSRQFTTLLVHTYASALANYTDQTIHFFPVRGGYAGKSTVQVSSQIERPDGPPVNVSYRLVAEGSGWKLYDLSVEGISMLGSFRSQFAEQLSKGDIESLIATLKEHNSGSSD
jgi:phospholipid transport system substrate-binding protein